MAMSPGSEVFEQSDNESGSSKSRRSPLSSPVQLQSVGGFENENVQLQSVDGFESENNRTSSIVTAQCNSNNVRGGRARGSNASVWDEKPPSF
eukprot:COSAG05_NODE_5877_length_1068_cov_1.057792_1_plen_92_part_01